jgi:16S rRNA processing protein RimM
MLDAGRVGRAHGLDGSFYVTQPRPSLLRKGIEVCVEEGEEKPPGKGHLGETPGESVPTDGRGLSDGGEPSVGKAPFGEKAPSPSREVMYGEIVRRAGTERNPIVRIAGVDSRASAQALRGRQLRIASQDAPQLAEDEWWSHELEGCLICDGERRVGTVIRLIELPSCEVLEVQAQPGDEPLLVPMVRDAIRRIDVNAGVIDVNMAFIEE